MKEYKKEFKKLSDLIDKEFNVYLRRNTRKQRYVDARFIFIKIAYELIIKDEDLISEYLKKDRTSIIYNLKLDAKNKLTKYFLNKYHYIRKCYISGNIENNIESLSIRHLLEKNKELEEQIYDYKKKETKINNLYKNVTIKSKYEPINEILSLEDEQIQFFIETRLKPFLRMLEVKPTVKID